MKNELATGDLELAGERLSLSDIKNDTYIVGAINDHIVPWMASYQATHLLAGEVRYVLTSGGHIAGIVNPPTPKAWFAVADDNPAEPAAWREAATRCSGSWWEDWSHWGSERAGSLGPPPPMGSDRYPAVGEAPGEYIRG
jgi:polyhydroxyalkanoate synthase